MTGQKMIKTYSCCLGSHKPEEGTLAHIHSLTQRMAATKNHRHTLGEGTVRSISTGSYCVVRLEKYVNVLCLESVSWRKVCIQMFIPKRDNDFLIFCSPLPSVQFSHSVVSDSVTPWTVARQASLSITNPQSLLRLMSI